MEFLLAPESRPFAVAAALLVFIVGIEMVMLLIGLSINDVVEHSFGHGAHAAGGLNWLNVGGVPILVLLVLALAAFSAAGFAMQGIAGAVARPMSGFVASLASVAVAVPVIRASSRVVARLVPRDETYAIEIADLVGRTGLVSRGPLDQGDPGSVRLKDQHGNWHMVRARAAKGQRGMPTGSPVLLVDLSQGVFAAVPAPPELQG